MEQLEFGGFVSFTLAIILLFIGKVALTRYEPLRRYSIPEPGLALISDIALGMFLVMALMGLKLWELNGTVAFLTAVMALQILMSVLFTLLVVFRLMGKDYEAAVISSGFGGITLGSTATAIVNMTAVTKQHGAAHQAFLLVPLVCGFFIDIVNAIAINFFVGL
jgi:glutamate:Na+ symporter, ESS family